MKNHIVKSERKSGFTITEIVIIMAIVAIMATMCFPYVIKAHVFSIDKVKARNVVEVEAAKMILVLPTSSGLPGAIGLDDPDLQIADNPDCLASFCSALNIGGLHQLEVNGEHIRFGTLSTRAVYTSSGATAD